MNNTLPRDNSYAAVMARRNDIMMQSVGIDSSLFAQGPLAFDYERMMRETAYDFAEVQRIQTKTNVGNTPMIELHNVTRLVRMIAPSGKGARIFIKDEACNPSGSFKARRASVSVHHAQKNGYPGVITATSGNYGAAVASQAAMKGLKCIVVQEIFDSHGIGQPEIIEKGRACEAYGAQVMQLTVGPELFYVMLRLLEETGFFNASLYTPFSIAGIETLGYEVVMDIRRLAGRDPDMVVVTHAGGGNLTGTVRGIQRANAAGTKVVAASVDLSTLHMASDRDFNRKSFTTGHTGFGVPFATVPDRSDVPRNAARSLRYMDRYTTVTQGEVFYTTEMLAQIEGLERGPAGNTALAAAVSLARELDQNQVLVVQETEYTGAGKHPTAQLTFARKMGVEVLRGDPHKNQPGKVIVIPEDISQFSIKEIDVVDLRSRYLRNAVSGIDRPLEKFEVEYLAKETNSSPEFVLSVLADLSVKTP